jgi:hypothetical protein
VTLTRRCEKFRADRDVRKRIYKNQALGSERFTFAELPNYFARRAKEADSDGFIPAPRETIAKNTGFSATSVGKHIDRGGELGILRKKVKTVLDVDPETKEVTARKVTYIAPAEGVVDFAEAAAKIASQKKANHGGDRIGCAKHPHADIEITTTTTKRCAICKVVLEQPKTTRRRVKQDEATQEANDQVGDLLQPTGTEGGNEKRAYPPFCEIPVIVTETPSFHNAGTSQGSASHNTAYHNVPQIVRDVPSDSIADAWLHGKSMPSSDPEPPPRTFTHPSCGTEVEWGKRCPTCTPGGLT